KEESSPRGRRTVGERREAVAGDYRDGRNSGKNIFAEFRTWDREENKDHAEPDQQKAQRGLLGSIRVIVGVDSPKCSQAARNEVEPRPGSARHDRNKKPWTPPMFSTFEIALQMFMHEEKLEETGIAQTDNDEPWKDNR